jgi:HEPN domain-containing protein
MTEMADRSRDWLAQAEQDLQAAASLAQAGHHEWACFVCQQAAEKAVKAVHLARGQESWGHRVARLLEELRDAPADLIEIGRSLDAFYIPTRYPNGHPEGAPFEQYGPLQSGEARRLARQVVDHARSHVP